ncbi:MAG: PadR family transcriptional regulator [Candidatus Dormibacteria bacterium]
MPKFTRSPAALVVLNLLCERPRHPYALRILIRERGIEMVVRMGSASIYDAVERLERAGYIEASAPTREGRRPERTVYSATEAGRDELRLWMAELLSEPVEEYPRFAAALAFAIGVGREATLDLLLRRVVRLESLVAASEKAAESVGDLPRIVLIEGEYAQALRVAELNWLRGIVDDIASGRLWTDAEIETLYARGSAADQDEHVVSAEIQRALRRQQTRKDHTAREGNHD